MCLIWDYQTKLPIFQAQRFFIRENNRRLQIYSIFVFLSLHLKSKDLEGDFEAGSKLLLYFSQKKILRIMMRVLIRAASLYWGIHLTKIKLFSPSSLNLHQQLKSIMVYYTDQFHWRVALQYKSLHRWKVVQVFLKLSWWSYHYL